MWPFAKSKPLITWLSGKTAWYPHTPDIKELQQKMRNLLFVYGDVMRPHFQNELMQENALFLAEAYTSERFCNVKKHLGKASYPIALPEGEYYVSERLTEKELGHKTVVKFAKERVPSSFIKGELYAAGAEVMLEVDRHLENRLLFRRKRVELIVPYREVRKDRHGQTITEKSCVSKIEAWMHIGVPSRWVIDADDLYSPVQRFKPHNEWLKEYSYFSNTETNV